MPSWRDRMRGDAAVRDLKRLLEEVLAGVLPQPAEIGRIDALAGLSNRAYRVRTELGEYVVKLRAPGPGDVLELEAEAALMERVAGAGLAPAVLGADRGRGALVTAYRPRARPWTRAMAREKTNIGRVASLLRTLHAQPAHLRSFECVACARRYIEAAAGGARAVPHEQRLAAELIRLAEEFEALYPPAVLCHNDLVAENILDEGVLLLVDFEYAMCSAPVLDLASFAAMNRLAGGERRALLAAYYGDGGMPPGASAFDRVVRLVQLIALFWARAVARGADDPKRFAEFDDHGPNNAG
jgi:Ser/Thr protein kinase RdoA (MazF antagonist)